MGALCPVLPGWAPARYDPTRDKRFQSCHLNFKATVQRRYTKRSIKNRRGSTALLNASPPIQQGRMARDMSDKEILKMELDQLQKEVKIERMPVSVTAKELSDWVEGQVGEDPLVKGIPEDKNPYKEK
ncbi:guanine nucleotide-binding protein G(I)/G(S)/G(O) subunit gamma-T2-like, partial [Scleropages formosus]